jgi:lysosomal alpha-mannosidase
MRLFSDMGFDAVFMARMDRHDKDERIKSKSMEFVWRPSNDTLGGNNQLLAHLLIDHYRSPTGLGFDTLDHET